MFLKGFFKPVILMLDGCYGTILTNADLLFFSLWIKDMHTCPYSLGIKDQWCEPKKKRCLK